MEPINRALLKENGKKALKRNFWVIMLVCLCANYLCAEFTGLTAGNSGGSNINVVKNLFTPVFSYEDNNSEFNYEDYIESFKNASSEDYKEVIDTIQEKMDEITVMDDEEKTGIIMIIIAVTCIISLLVYLLVITFSFLIGSFLGAPIGVGYRRFFMLNRLDKTKFTELFSSFRKGKYMKIVTTCFKTNIEIYLWRLVFYFPGLIKFYQYFFVRYIVAENPDIDPKRAKELSKQMTEGHKWQIFVLQLSFLGWYLVFILEFVILTICSCGLLSFPATLLIYPLTGYQNVTYAELYEERREYALVTGMAKKEELIGFEELTEISGIVNEQ